MRAPASRAADPSAPHPNASATERHPAVMLLDGVIHPKRVMCPQPVRWDGGADHGGQGCSGGEHDGRGRRISLVDDKVLRVRDTVVIKDREGRELLRLQKRLLRARDTMAIERD